MPPTPPHRRLLTFNVVVTNIANRNRGCQPRPARRERASSRPHTHGTKEGGPLNDGAIVLLLVAAAGLMGGNELVAIAAAGLLFDLCRRSRSDPLLDRAIQRAGGDPLDDHRAPLALRRRENRARRSRLDAPCSTGLRGCPGRGGRFLSGLWRPQPDDGPPRGDGGTRRRFDPRRLLTRVASPPVRWWPRDSPRSSIACSGVMKKLETPLTHPGNFSIIEAQGMSNFVE